MSVLNSIINSLLYNNGDSGSESTIVPLHVQQMCEWGVRGGNIEFRPVQDDKYDSRLKFLSSVWEDNALDSKLDYAMTALTCCGELCWFILPNRAGDGYHVDFFIGGANAVNPEFKAFYKAGGRELDRVIIIYTYDIDAPFGMPQKRWVKITVTDKKIGISESATKLDFKSANNYGYNPQAGTYGESAVADTHTYDNPFYPNLPIIISKNNARRSGQVGRGDFHAISQLIEVHASLVRDAHINLRQFSSPSLVTTRSANEVLESGQRPPIATWGSQNRFIDSIGDAYSGSTNPLDAPAWGTARGAAGFIGDTSTANGNVARIIGGVGEGERFGYIQADPVNGDQNQWIAQTRELIHYCLGGVDPLGIHSGATFGEVKTLFGRVQNTADKKAKALYKYGLCKVFELLIWAEEQKFKKSLFEALKKYYPEKFPLNNYQQLGDEDCQELQQLMNEGIVKLPPNLLNGLVPLGDRRITWRYTKEVFNNSTRDLLDLSIAGRNAREDGMKQEFVLRTMYPNLTDKEIRNMMSGFSPRVVGAANQAIAQLMQLFQQFMSLPDPQNPNAPWGMRLGVPQLVEEAMLTLGAELSYGRPSYDPAEPIDRKIFSKFTQNEYSADIPESASAPTSPGWREPTNSLSTYGLPASTDALYAATRPNAAARRDREFSRLAEAEIIPSPGATISGQSIWDSRIGDSTQLRTSDLRLPATPGNPIDESLIPLYRERLFNEYLAARESELAARNQQLAANLARSASAKPSANSKKRRPN